RRRSNRLWEIREEYGYEERGADRPALEDSESEDEGFRDPVQDDPERDRERGARRLSPAGSLPVSATDAIDEEVTAEEDERASEQGAEDDPLAVRGREGLVD